MKGPMRSAVVSIAFSSLVALGALASPSAWAEDANTSDAVDPQWRMDRPITGYRWVDPDMFDSVSGDPSSQAHSSKIIYLNRCLGGCSIGSSGGFGDSRTNTSFLVRGGTAQITPWNKGDAQWEELVACVTAMYDPYDVVITDVDPGPDVEHFEAIVAGKANEIGEQAGVGGIAPFSCGVINNAITFSFANSSFYADGIDGICETVGQETAHAFGLEHEFLCTDPMTYLQPCGYKWFQDENAPCGEYQARGCDCGQANQNSHRMLKDEFGVGANPGPKVEFLRPAPNSNVSPNFVIEVSAGKYYYGVERMEVFVNGTSLGTATSAPFIFNAPPGLDGYTTLEVKATDVRGYEGTSTAEINVGSSCSTGECPSGRVCYKAFCVADATTEGGFGASCDSDSACLSNICGKDNDGVGVCTDTCELNKGQCPKDFGCLKAGSSGVCWPGVSEDTGGCGCNSADPKGGIASLLLVGFGLVFLRRRRII